MSDLGRRPAAGRTAGVINKVTSGAWVVTFALVDMPREPYEIWHGVARGPGGFAEMYLDEEFVEVLENGRRNVYDPNVPLFVMPGTTPSFHWSIATGNAPTVTLFLRTPEAGRI